MSEADKSGLVVFIVFFAIPSALLAIYVIACFLVDARRKRAELYLAHVQARLAQGLPEHERCLCEECVEWRRHIDHMRGYERGLL